MDVAPPKWFHLLVSTGGSTMPEQKPSDSPPDLTSLWQEHWGLGDDLGKMPDLAFVWQSAMSEWAQGFEKLARSFSAAGHEVWAQAGADLPAWQDQWRNTLEQYEDQARPFQQEMVNAPPRAGGGVAGGRQADGRRRDRRRGARPGSRAPVARHPEDDGGGDRQGFPRVRATGYARSVRTERFRQPSASTLMMEWRAGSEFAAFLATWPLLLGAPLGDGHTVLVLPPFGTSDRYTHTAAQPAPIAGLRRRRVGARAQPRAHP